MPLAIDTSSRLGAPHELLALVEAIHNAPSSEQETRYIEWKSQWDLRNSAKDRFSATKHILGFANREVAQAARFFEGCAYLVAGVAPRDATGIPREDSATLSAWLVGYLGTAGPVWTPEWVQFDGVNVLVLTIEAPQSGDPIHTLRKAYATLSPGRVFTRREGQTVEADPDEHKMLEARLLDAKSPGTHVSSRLDLIARMADELFEISQVAWSEQLDPGSVPRLEPTRLPLSPIPRMCARLEVTTALYVANGGVPLTQVIEFCRLAKSAGANRAQIASEAAALMSRLEEVAKNLTHGDA